MEWWMNLLIAYIHHSEVQVITALSLISAHYKSPQHPLSLFPAWYVFKAGHGSRVVWGKDCLRSLGRYDRGFEYHFGHGYLMCVFFCVCVAVCVGTGLVMGCSPVQGVLPTIWKVKKLKWNGTFHGCPMLRKGATGNKKYLQQTFPNNGF
jgi:hypothetical protein